MAIAFCLTRRFMTSAIIGATTMAQLKTDIGAAISSFRTRFWRRSRRCIANIRCRSEPARCRTLPAGLSHCAGAALAHRKASRTDTSPDTTTGFGEIVAVCNLAASTVSSFELVSDGALANAAGVLPPWTASLQSSLPAMSPAIVASLPPTRKMPLRRLPPTARHHR
jgi:hypothetical protein